MSVIYNDPICKSGDPKQGPDPQVGKNCTDAVTWKVAQWFLVSSEVYSVMRFGRGCLFGDKGKSNMNVNSSYSYFGACPDLIYMHAVN